MIMTRVMLFLSMIFVLLCCTSCLRQGEAKSQPEGEQIFAPIEEETIEQEVTIPSESDFIPYVEIIPVYDELFEGFTDLTYETQGILEEAPNKKYIEDLINYHFIKYKLHPDDPKSEFKPKTAIKRVEVVALLINAFSGTEIKPDEEYYENVIERIKKDSFPKEFTTKLGTDYDSWIVNLNNSIPARESLLLTMFCYEKYIGSKYPLPGSTVDRDHLELLTYEDCKAVIENITDYTSEENNKKTVVLFRYQYVKHLWDFAAYALELWGEPMSGSDVWEK